MSKPKEVIPDEAFKIRKAIWGQTGALRTQEAILLALCVIAAKMGHK